MIDLPLVAELLAIRSGVHRTVVAAQLEVVGNDRGFTKRHLQRSFERLENRRRVLRLGYADLEDC
ncbi:MAG: hypothetical protein ACYDHD_03585, partial [Vulcanimicrobiaceae bacterium]